jgi:deoxyribodipyrimidine photo-lyase
VTAVLWLRRDLRISDHPALAAAAAGGGPVVPFFCIDPALLGGRFASGPRTQFMLESLADLGRSLALRGSGLVIRSGDPAVEVVRLAREVGADTVHATVDAGPFARQRDRATAGALKDAGIALVGHPGLFAVDNLDALRTGAGGPFQVFTPFYRAWLGVRRRPALAAPDRLPGLPAGLEPDRVPRLEELGLSSPLRDPMRGGEQAGLACWQRFCEDGLERYGSGRDDLGADASSRLSPYLHFGCLSPRMLETGGAAAEGEGPEEFRRQLAWRDFYAQVMRAFPNNRRHEHQSRYRDRVAWRRDEADFRRWQAGLTGYPLVDAGMRQLASEGWMHNRARLVVGSFLTKELGIDWRWGERHFMELLLDGDVASNNGNWQWIASVGVDPQPVSRRILSPSRQQERFDPSGAYVRRWVPELADVPAPRLTEPWTMSDAEQQLSGCVIGVDYPAPIVDRQQARAAALQRFAQAAAAA